MILWTVIQKVIPQTVVSQFDCTAVVQSNCETIVPCALTLGVFCLLRQLLLIANGYFGIQPAISPRTVHAQDDYNMDKHMIVTI